MSRRLLTLALVLAPTSAHAGRTFYGWLYGTEVMPERGVELQSWIAEQNGQNTTPTTSQTTWWTAAVVGITDQLELAIPAEMMWGQSIATDPTTGITSVRPFTAFDRYGGELRYRFVTQDPVDAPEFVPLVRAAVYRSVLTRDEIQPEVDVVASYQTGRFHGLVDIGGYADLSTCGLGQAVCPSQKFELHPGGGVSIEAIGDLRFGAEVHAEIGLIPSGGDSWVIAGPNMSWSHGRFWISAAYGIGVYHMRDAPKVQWGIAF